MSALATSYLVWFVALGTYTLQVGGAGAVFFVSYQNGRSLLRAALDVLPYIALLVIYVMIWTTTTPAGGESDIYRLSFSFDALLKSIAAGLWNKSYGIFWIWLWNSGPWLMTATFTILAVLILVTIRYDLPIDSHRPPQFPTLAFALLIGICVVAPTIAVESMSSTWFPGTRWTSLLQFWSPLLYCVMVFALLSIFLPAHWQLLWQSLTACAAAFIVVLDLGVNNTQIVHTRQERAFFSELQHVVSQDRASGLKFPRRYVIRLVDPAPYLALAQAVAPGYARTLLGRDATFTIFKVVRPEPGVEDTVLFWKDEHLNRSLSD
jgi:hypothetical protein